MKKEYTQPIVEVIVLDTEDIVTASDPIQASLGGGLDGDTETDW